MSGFPWLAFVILVCALVNIVVGAILLHQVKKLG